MRPRLWSIEFATEASAHESSSGYEGPYHLWAWPLLIRLGLESSSPFIAEDRWRHGLLYGPHGQLCGAQGLHPNQRDLRDLFKIESRGNGRVCV